jgi:hypothetical protein
VDPDPDLQIWKLLVWTNFESVSDMQFVKFVIFPMPSLRVTVDPETNLDQDIDLKFGMIGIGELGPDTE